MVHEEILEAIETTRRKLLILTADKIIVAKPKGTVLSMAIDMIAEFLIGWVPFFGGVLDVDSTSIRAEKKEKLCRLSPESILTADKKNFAIPYSDVIRLEMSKGFLGSKVKIMIGVNKHQFKLRNTNEYYKCMSALKTVLEDKLTVS